MNAGDRMDRIEANLDRITARVDAMSEGSELLQGMICDLVAKIDALTDAVAGHERHINDTLDILLGH